MIGNRNTRCLFLPGIAAIVVTAGGILGGAPAVAGPARGPVVAAGEAAERTPRSPGAGSIDFVIHISVDGLRPDAITFLGSLAVPTFYRLRIEGAFTDNARNDYDFTNTLPNHTCILTGRGVNGPDGHNVDFNSDNGGTIADAHGFYVAGVFDVVHDHGFPAAMYASKTKFAVFDRSWNEVNGEPDTVGADDGRDKIDRYVYNSDTAALTDTFLAHMAAGHFTYSFIHFADPDGAGHAYGWMSEEYLDVVEAIDGRIGRIIDLVAGDPVLAGRTALIVTADHGGFGTNHSDPTIWADYTIPLYVWGPGVPAGAGLYWLNQASRFDPGQGRPDYTETPQPMRNGGTGNLALGLLGLPAISGSTIDALQDLTPFPPPGSGDLPAVAITSPDDGAAFQALDPVTFDVDASTVTGSIDRVEFFANWQEIHEDTLYPYSFTWNGVPLGSITITARAVRDDSLGSTASIGIVVSNPTTQVGDETVPSVRHRLYPNPFGRSATLDFTLSGDGPVTLSVYDVRGRRVRTIALGALPPGRHSASLDAAGLAPGLYFYRLGLGRRFETGKLMIVR